MRLLLYFLIGFLIFRFIGSLFRPRTVRQSRTYQNFENQKVRKEGEVSVNMNNQKKDKQISKNEGDYVDYEEV